VMSDDRRNPYVILGVRFGASAREARSGFSKAKRRLRLEQDVPYSQEDLTWALHQIEQIILSPELAFDVYRIPAIDLGEARGVFNPAPHRLERATEPASPQIWHELHRSAVSAAIRSLLSQSPFGSSGSIPYEPTEV